MNPRVIDYEMHEPEFSGPTTDE